MQNLGIPAITARIYVGLKNRDTGMSRSVADAEEIIQRYVNASKGTPAGCVTVTPTSYLYTDGREEGVIVGFENYPRFPASYADIRRHAMDLAKILVEDLEQYRVTVVMGTESILVNSKKAEDNDLMEGHACPASLQ